jgi:para-nitrobenzyl esterase
VTTAEGPEVRTTAGPVRGRAEDGLAVFRGVPFADLPARFAAPTPPETWDDVREATAFGPPPPQSGVIGTEALTADDTGWLTLNIWAPEAAEALPVLVWVQGGGYVFGTSGLPEYDGARLARGGVVAVTFNYRVGAEGFALVPGTPPNRGLLDQVAALTWVRDNVASFGGDPSRVTVFGQSAGAGSIAALLAMPAAHGLLRRAIVQSMPGVYHSPALAADVTRVLAASLGVAPHELPTVPTDRLTAAGDRLLADLAPHADRWGQAAYGGAPFAPVVDGTVLPTTPWEALRSGVERDVDLVVGHTRHEQRLLSLMEGTLGQVTDEQATAALERFAPGPDGVAAYRSGDEAADTLHDRVRSDWLFRMPSLQLAEAHSGTTYLYELTWPAPGMGGLLGACHGLDVPLAFGTLTEGQPAMLVADDVATAEVVSAQLRSAWTAFATHGDPGWPAYDAEQRLTRLFDVEPTVAAYPEEDSRRIWSDHTFDALPLLAT